MLLQMKPARTLRVQAKSIPPPFRRANQRPVAVSSNDCQLSPSRLSWESRLAARQAAVNSLRRNSRATVLERRRAGVVEKTSSPADQECPRSLAYIRTLPKKLCVVKPTPALQFLSAERTAVCRRRLRDTRRFCP